MRTEGAFRGRLPSFTEVRALAEAFGATAGADHLTTLRVVLVLEELFTNTVIHGYRAGGEGLVWVALASTGGAIEVTYEDAAPPFDPLSCVPGRRAAVRGGDEQEPGGLGLALVRGLSASAAYARVGDRNRITLVVSAGGSAPTLPP
jgi:serine/threonine-protein kinase RsbW